MNFPIFSLLFVLRSNVLFSNGKGDSTFTISILLVGESVRGVIGGIESNLILEEGLIVSLLDEEDVELLGDQDSVLKLSLAFSFNSSKLGE
jgi:hypothetical protein